MKESSEKDNNENSLICSICHQKKLNIKKNYTKIKKVFNDNLKDNELSELIKKCNCNNIKEINNEIYVHKYCILLKIIFNFDIKCEKCNTIYNIQIKKKKDKIRKICLYAIFLIIYIIHLFIYLFCMFLLFINVILKEYTNKKYKHLSIFFGIILLILNTIFLYFTIRTNIKKNKNIYKYTINIFDIINDNNNFTIKDKEKEFYKLLIDFYQWFYNCQIKNLLTIINKKLFNNKISNFNGNSIKNFIKENNNKIIQNKKNEKNINESKIKNQSNIKINNYPNYNNSKEIILKDNKFDILNNKNIYLNQNPKNIQKDNENYLKKESQEDLIINRAESNNSNNNINSRATNNIDSINNINHNDYINININPRTSKNININIHFSSDKNSIIDYSSSKERVFSSKRVNKYGKTALIPKKLTMTNIISEANSFKRKRRLIKSIKIKEYNLHLKDTGLPANIAEDEEVDFSDFEKIDSKISKDIKDRKTIVSKNNLDLKYNNLRSKKSYKDIDLNISNSDPAINNDEMFINSNIRNTLKHHLTDKHVHFATPGNN